MILVQKTDVLQITAEEAGKKFAEADEDTQREFLLAFAEASSKFDWNGQSYEIANDLSREDKNKVLDQLRILCTYLEG